MMSTDGLEIVPDERQGLLDKLEDLLNRHPYLLVEDPEVADVVVKCQEMVFRAQETAELNNV